MNILFIACYSPLINNSASIETLQYLNNLAKIQENKIHLLTVDFPKDSVYYDEEVFKLLDKKVEVHAVSGGALFEKVMPRKGSGVVLANGGNKSGLKRKIKSIIAVPDMYLNWAYKASKLGKELVKTKDIDVIFSMHEPPSSHICAHKIKKEFKDIPWITYWSDPWLKDSSRENSGAVRRIIEGNFEKGIIELSDKHIFVTKANRDDYIKSYGIPKESTYIITRGYEEELYSEISKMPKGNKLKDDKVNVIYAGEIFKKLRDINPFVDAISDEEIKQSANIMFFGNIDDDNAKMNLAKIDNASIEGRIPYVEALNYVINSDVLLIFGNKNSKQIPAKIYDYFGCNGYILIVLGDENDPIKEVAQDIDKCIIVNNDKEEIRNAMIKLIQRVKTDGLSTKIEEYEWSNISKRLNEILKG